MCRQRGWRQDIPYQVILSAAAHIFPEEPKKLTHGPSRDRLKVVIPHILIITIKSGQKVQVLWSRMSEMSSR